MACKHDKDIREIRNDVKKLLPLVGEFRAHRVFIVGIVLALVGLAFNAIAGG